LLPVVNGGFRAGWHTPSLPLPDGELNSMSSELAPVANSKDESDQLRPLPENVEQWFMPQLVRDLISGGARLDAGECFSEKISPSLGGTFEPSNFEVCRLPRHFAAMGKIQAHVKRLSPGTRITSVQARMTVDCRQERTAVRVRVRVRKIL
jgi:hypothetical protein